MTGMEDRIAVLEAILAREIIDLAADFRDNESVMDSMTEICFTIDRLIDETGNSDKSHIPWYDLFSYYDQNHIHLKGHTAEVPSYDDVTQAYDKAEYIIANNSKRAE